MKSPWPTAAWWRDLATALPWLLPGIAVRVWFQLTGRCILDSDEGIKGLAMIEALRGEIRVFFHGQDYMGSLPSIIGAPSLLLVGANPNGLRFVCLFHFVIVLLIWRSILRRLGAGGAWPWLAILLGFAPAYMVEWTIRARGTVEGILVGSIWLWVLVRIIVDSRPFANMKHWFLALGLATGIAWWTTQLTIFFFLPGAALFLSEKRVRDELQALCKEPLALLLLATTVLTAVAFLRATLHFMSPLQNHLWSLRIPLMAAWITSLTALLVLTFSLRKNQWATLTLAGLAVGYLPPLLVVWTKEEIYNTSSLQSFHAWSGNLFTFLLIGVLDLLGIGSERTSWTLAWSVAAVYAFGAMLAAISLLALGVLAAIRARKAPERIDLLLTIAGIWSVTFYCLAAPASVPLGHYGVFVGFFQVTILALFFWRLQQLHRVAAIIVSLPLIAINLVSIFQMPRTPIEWRTGIEKVDAQVIRFLLDRDITIAATSLSGSSTGYWEAYRLTYSSGERLRVHPILHMPRVDRYREELQKAEHTAIITTAPEMITTIFEDEGITFELEDFGRLKVIHGFDKAHVDRLALIDYRRRLDE